MTSIHSGATSNAEPAPEAMGQTSLATGQGRWRRVKTTRDKSKHLVKVVLTILTVLIPLAVLALGLLVVVDGPHRPQVEASFARVGGLTRIETAADAARFWLHAPAHVVKTPATSPGWVMLDAAECAMDEDAPLLFTPNARSNGVVAGDLIRRWRANDPVTVKTITVKQLRCDQRLAAPSSLHTLTENQDIFPSDLGPTPEAGLGKFVISYIADLNGHTSTQRAM